MKKIIAIAIAPLFAATCLCGCGKSSASEYDVATPEPAEPQQTQSQQQDDKDRDQNNKIEIIFDGSKGGFHGEIKGRGALPGTYRHFIPDRSGNYTVEYIHAPYGIDKDTTLDYDLTLNEDNTFKLTVVSEGVTADHSGRWYERSKTIMLFYDEDIDTPQHNVYVADSLYADILPQGKLMIYDNCHTIVLSRRQTEKSDANQAS